MDWFKRLFGRKQKDVRVVRTVAQFPRWTGEENRAIAEYLGLSLPHSPASGSRPEGPRGDERTPDGRLEEDG